MNNIFKILLIVLIMTNFVYGQTPSTRQIKEYIKSDDTNAIKNIISNGLNINTLFNRHSTLLYLATDYGKLDIVKLLVEKGADLNIQNKDNFTPILISTLNGNDSISEYLIIKGAKLNIVGPGGSTALRNTIIMNSHTDIKIFKLLVDKGADINFKCDKCCNTSIFLYCCAWGTPEMIQLLIDKNIDVNQTNCKGVNGLMLAIINKNIENIKQIINTGIDINHVDKKGLNAHDYAIKIKNKKIIDLIENKKQ